MVSLHRMQLYFVPSTSIWNLFGGYIGNDFHVVQESNRVALCDGKKPVTHSVRLHFLQSLRQRRISVELCDIFSWIIRQHRIQCDALHYKTYWSTYELESLFPSAPRTSKIYVTKEDFGFRSSNTPPGILVMVNFMNIVRNVKFTRTLCPFQSAISTKNLSQPADMPGNSR